MSVLTENDLKLTIPERFSQVVSHSPELVAIQLDKREITYGELYRQSQSVTNYLAAVLGTEQVPIPVLHSSQKEIIPLLLGIVNAGHMYSALSASDPVARISSVLENLHAPLLIVTHQNLLMLAKEACPPNTRIVLAKDVHHESSIAIKVSLSPDSFAVITYTSGSTGEPKGVLRTHKMVLHQSWTYHDQFSINEKSRMLGIRPYSTSSSLSELFAPLLNGATIVPFDLKEDGLGKLSHTLKAQKISMMRPPIQVIRSFMDSLSEGEIFPDLQYVFATGDVFYRKDVERLRKIIPPEAVIIHQFAMSEAGILAVNHISHDSKLDSEVIPAGLPVKGKELLILNENGQQLPQGEVGEIYVRTKVSFPGYWGAQNQPSNRFLPDPADSSQKVFSTGDLGRILPDGQLEHTGRKDWRVKILGFSVDLSAIEHTFMKNPEVQRAIVVALPDMAGEKRLVAYILPSLNTQPNAKDLLKFVASNLPAYMVPSLIMMVPDLPIGAAGKVDRKALPVPNWDNPELSAQYASARNSIENQLVEIWKKVLQVKQVGVNDNFFELGGDSLKALEMTLEVEKTVSKYVSQSFFKRPTIASLAILLESEEQAGSEKDKFAIESFKKNVNPQKVRKITVSNLKKVVIRKYSLHDVDKIVDLMVARKIVNMPYLEASEWAVKWSQNAFVREFLYRRRYALFTQWVASLKDCQVQPFEAFQMSVLSNMNFGISKYLGKKEKSIKSDLLAYKKSPYPYWQTLGELFDAIPAGQLNENFPINGLDHLEQAYNQGKGVILLTFHGMPKSGRFFALQRFLNLDNIPTISYQIPIRQSQYHNRKEQMSMATASTLNAEIALFGQRQLLDGKIINIVGDTGDPYGQTYQSSISGRAYQLKSGFAELSLNTGAKIIPHSRYCLSDGRTQLNFGAPLTPGNGDRRQQVESLLNNYTTFIEQTWATHPESVRWEKIKKHLSRTSLKIPG